MHPQERMGEDCSSAGLWIKQGQSHGARGKALLTPAAHLPFTTGATGGFLVTTRAVALFTCRGHRAA